MILEEEVYKLRQLESLAGEESFNTNWMGYEPSRAFLIALGAGPWKVDRRKAVQQKALEWFSHKYHDLVDIPDVHQRIFPLDWQNKFLENMVSSLKKANMSFKFKCQDWRRDVRWERAAVNLFNMCGIGKQGTKVLWMFIRDFLELPSFPIDRHIKRMLQEVNLPNDVWYIVALCQRIGTNPNDLNRKLFATKAINIDLSKDSTTVKE